MFIFYSIKVLYSRIAIALWKSSHGFERQIAMQNTSTLPPTGSAHSGGGGGIHTGNGNFLQRSCSKYEKRPVGVTESQVRVCFFFF